MDLPQRKGFITPQSVSFEVAHNRPGGPINPMPVARAGTSHRIAVINKLRPEGPAHRLLCPPFRALQASNTFFRKVPVAFATG
jgi:hypothetical protein